MIMSLLGVVYMRTTPSGLLQYLLKRIYLTLPTLDLALFTTNLLTDNMSREDYAWWFLALNYFLGPQSSSTSTPSFLQPSISCST